MAAGSSPLKVSESLDRVLSFDIGGSRSREADEVLPRTLLELPEDVYGNKFFPQEHWNFAGVAPELVERKRSFSRGKMSSNKGEVRKIRENLGEAAEGKGSGKGEACVVSVASESVNGFYECLQTTVSGFAEFTIQQSDLEEKGTKRSVTSRIETHLERRFPSYRFYHVADENVNSELQKLEQKHPIARTQVKVAVVYCRDQQSTMPEFFSNSAPDPRFQKFLDALGSEIDLSAHVGFRGDMGQEGKSIFTQFENCEVMFHVTTMMHAEQHRRLVGNDVAVVFYKEGGPFEPAAVDGLGTVPQVFSVVQPADDVKEGYKIAFMERTNVKPAFGPHLPEFAHVYSPQEMRNFVLTRMINGTTRAFHCPPMNRLFIVPRGATLAQLVLSTLESRQEAKRREQERLRKVKELQKSESAVAQKVDIVARAGRNLASKDSNGFSDPYLVFTLTGQKSRTLTKKKTLNPVWDERFTFSLAGVSESEVLLIQCWDWDRFSKDDFMGEVRIPVKKILTTYANSDRWYPLRVRSTHPKEEISGDIHLHMCLNGHQHLDDSASDEDALVNDIDLGGLDDDGIEIDI